MGRALLVPIAPLWSTRTWLSAVYLALALAIGFAEFLVLVIGGAIGIGLSIVWIGLPILVLLLALSRSIAAFDRGLANSLLGVEIEAPSAARRFDGSIWRRLGQLVRSPSTWRALIWLAIRFPLALLAAIPPLACVTAGYVLLQLPRSDLLDASVGARTASVVAGIAMVLLALHVIDLGGFVHARVARWMLGPSRRETLALAQVRAERASAQADLARELHDSVGHSLTAAVLQATAARKVLDQDPAFAATALEAIETQGREALQELDRVLGLLRHERADDARAPGLDGLDALFARTRAAGLALTVEQRGNLADATPELGRAAYRIIQEGLTNVMRHASGAIANVSIAVADGSLTIAITNGPGTQLEPDRASGGRGLRGVRERVSGLGGTLEVGPTPDGGYALRAVLPRA